jgi:hypothetical protein
MFPRPDDRPSPHLSSLALERIVAGDPRAAAASEAHLAACAPCQARRAELARDTAQLLRDLDVPRAVGALLRAVAPAPRPWYRRPSFAAACVGLAACAALVVFTRDDGSRDEPADGRRKGSLAFEVIRRDLRGHVGEVASGDQLAPGEAIRFRVVSRDPGFLAIFGVDAAQAVTAYGSSLALEGGVPRLLDGSIILDDTLGPERIVAVVCAWPLAGELGVALARGALAMASGDPRQLGRIAPGCREASVVIEKVAP